MSSKLSIKLYWIVFSMLFLSWWLLTCIPHRRLCLTLAEYAVIVLRVLTVSLIVRCFCGRLLRACCAIRIYLTTTSQSWGRVRCSNLLLHHASGVSIDSFVADTFSFLPLSVVFPVELALVPREYDRQIFVHYNFVINVQNRIS